MAGHPFGFEFVSRLVVEYRLDPAGFDAALSAGYDSDGSEVGPSGLAKGLRAYLDTFGPRIAEAMAKIAMEDCGRLMKAAFVEGVGCGKGDGEEYGTTDAEALWNFSAAKGELDAGGIKPRTLEETGRAMEVTINLQYDGSVDPLALNKPETKPDV